jgi:hypothetical protein
MHYAGQSDIQTAAMLSCMFGCRTENQIAYRKKAMNKNVSVSFYDIYALHKYLPNKL